jgi:hypothetical protein
MEQQEIWVSIPLQPLDHGAIGAVGYRGAKASSLAFQFEIFSTLNAEKIGDRAIVVIPANPKLAAAWAVDLVTNPMFTQVLYLWGPLLYESANLG